MSGNADKIARDRLKAALDAPSDSLRRAHLKVAVAAFAQGMSLEEINSGLALLHEHGIVCFELEQLRDRILER